MQRTIADQAGKARTGGRRAVAVVMLIILLMQAGAWAQHGLDGAAARAVQLARHQALWATCRACLIEPPAGPPRAEAREGAEPRRISPYESQSVEGMPAVAVVEGQVVSVQPQLTPDGRRVFTDYDLVVGRVIQNSTLLPVTVGATVVVTRPGGAITVRGARKVVSVSGYPALAAGTSVRVTLVALPDVGSYQEVSVQPLAGKEW